MLRQQPLRAGVVLTLFLAAGGCARPAPDGSRPALVVEATYPGASAATVEDAVAAPIEQQINGVENLLSLVSRCTDDGRYTLHVTFAHGTDLNTAQVLVLNRINLAEPVLPEAVRRLGIRVRQRPAGVLAIAMLSSPDGDRGELALTNYAHIQLRDELDRVPGVGDVALLGVPDHGLYLWLDPDALTARRLTPPDVTRALAEQQALLRPLDPEQVADILVRTDADGRAVHLRDVARVELGAGPRRGLALLDGKPTAALAIYAAPRARPAEVSAALRERLAMLRDHLPPGLALDVFFDFTPGAADRPAPGQYLLADPALPEGVSAERALALLGSCEAAVRGTEGVRHTLALSENPFSPYRTGPCVLAALAPGAGKEAVRARLERFEGADVRLCDLSGPGRLPPLGGYPIDLAVSGPEPGRVRDLAEELVRRLARGGRLTDLRAGPGAVPERSDAVDVDAAAVKAHGVAAADLATTLQVYRGSCVAGGLTLYGRSWPVRVQLAGEGRDPKDDLRRLRVANARGELIPLSQLVTVRPPDGPAVIERFDFQPMVAITGNPAPGVSLGAARGLCEAAAAAARQELGLSPEYRLTWLHDLPPAEPPPPGERTAADAPPPGVTVSRPVVREVTDTEDFTGRAEAATRVELRARVTGYLEKVLFKPGSDVKQGDVLFQLDSRPYQARVDQAQANLDVARASVARAEATYKRSVAAARTGAATREDVDRDKADVELAQATLRQAQAALEVARLNLDFTKIVAPISGRIGGSNVDPGNMVRADDTVLATLVTQDPMYVYFNLDERTVLRLRQLAREGELPVRLGLAGEEGYPRQGKVNFVDNQVDPNTGTLRARAVTANGDGLIVPGMSVRVRLAVGAPRKALLVAEQAVQTDQGQKFVYVVGDDDRVAYRRVRVGAAQDGLRVVEEGLRAGDRVVVGGLRRVRPGLKVRPGEAAPARP